jgi:hypothetical protein
MTSGSRHYEARAGIEQSMKMVLPVSALASVLIVLLIVFTEREAMPAFPGGAVSEKGFQAVSGDLKMMNSAVTQKPASIGQTMMLNWDWPQHRDAWRQVVSISERNIITVTGAPVYLN